MRQACADEASGRRASRRITPHRTRPNRATHNTVQKPIQRASAQFGPAFQYIGIVVPALSLPSTAGALALGLVWSAHLIFFCHHIYGTAEQLPEPSRAVTNRLQTF